MEILRSYTQISFFKGFLSKIFIVFTKYECFHSDTSEKDDILLFIAFERTFGRDHLDQLKVINDALNCNDRRGSLIGYRRKFTYRYIWSFCKLRNIEALALRQMKDARCEFSLLNYKKCLVHCDIVPLQAFVVKTCNNISIETFTLQHGFYPSPNSSEQWLTEYRCSESKYFFAWDAQTISYFKSVGNNKTFLQTGPFLTLDQTILPRSIEPSRVIFFLPAKSEIAQIAFMIRLGELYKVRGKKVLYICHPNFDMLTKTFLSLRRGIIIKYPRYKKSLRTNDVCFVLNSSVWVELELNYLKVIILDNYFTSDQEFWIDFDLLEKHENTYVRKLFLQGTEALNAIVQNLLNNQDEQPT